MRENERRIVRFVIPSRRTGRWYVNLATRRLEQVAVHDPTSGESRTFQSGNARYPEDNLVPPSDLGRRFIENLTGISRRGGFGSGRAA